MPSTRAILGLVGAFGLTACATAVPPWGPTERQWAWLRAVERKVPHSAPSCRAA